MATSSGAAYNMTQSENLTVGQFVTSLGTGMISSVVLLAVFYILKLYLPRIYRPRTYLVPERERTEPPPAGLWRWIIPIFCTKNSEFIHKCGLDAFFFLRYLRMLLKIFVPMACIILPILLPINATGGNSQVASMSSMLSQSNSTANPNSANSTNTASSGNSTVSGLNVLAWSNISVYNHNRFWAHLVLAVLAIIFICYNMFIELRSYIRIRQAYLTSPQHRLRASATTVLVKAIPDKWNTPEALDGLFDVFPGGVRNIWINRDFQELSDKIDLRDTIAQKLESAEVNLIKQAREKHAEQVKQALKNQAKSEGKKVKDLKAEAKKRNSIDKDGAVETVHEQGGISAGNPHQIRTLRQFFNRDGPAEDQGPDADEDDEEADKKRSGFGLGVVGEGIGAFGEGIGAGFGAGIGAVNQGFKGVTRFGGQGFGAVSHGVGKFTRFGRRQEEHPAGATDEGSVAGDDDTTARPSTEPKPASPSTLAGTPLTPKARQAKKDEDLLSSGFDDLDVVTQSHWRFWEKSQPMPTPQPHAKEDSEFPLGEADAARQLEEGEGLDPGMDSSESSVKDDKAVQKKSKSSHHHKTKYPPAYDADVAAAELEDEDATWRQYVKPKDREHMRLKLFGWNWMPFLPTWLFLGKKVDTIYYCRKELARLNLEIEQDQKEPEKFPLMNSAFIQFNHQVAAHMACQALSHHLPQQMNPKMIEIAPDDVIWDNMAIKWWEAYLRTGGIILVISAMIVFWAIPSVFVGGLSQLNKLESLPGFAWVADIGEKGQIFVQGVVPAVITALLFILVPVILQIFHRLAGCSTGNEVQMETQKSYFAFLFVNLFLVVTISAGITSVAGTFSTFSQFANPALIPAFLAKNLPQASNYFFNYMILQGLSTSAGALAQVGTLVSWVLLAPLLDTTPRQRWKRRVNLPTLSWGTFFPPYTNFACIGIVYSIIAPIIMIFNIITFGLFWIAYRYNTLYVNKYRFDTGGLLYPVAINQLFTGLYVMEIVLIGLFLLVQQPDANGDGGNTTVCEAQAIIMIVVLVFTALYQIVLNLAFGPLLQYLPITLEDEAVMRDEAFARAQDTRWMREESQADEEHDPDESAPPRLPSHDGAVESTDHASRQPSDSVELRNLSPPTSQLSPNSWSRPRRSSRSGDFGRETVDLTHGAPRTPASPKRHTRAAHAKASTTRALDTIIHPPESKKGRQDVEAQSALEHEEAFLFGDLSDTIEDLTPEERDVLVDRAFRHRALRARRPCIWIPRDALGVADDEVRRTEKLTDYIWISNEGAVLTIKGAARFRRSPPDFSDIDLVEL